MKIQDYTRIAFGWAKRYIDERISKVQNNTSSSGTEKDGVPKMGSYTLSTRLTGIVTKRNWRYATGVTLSRCQGCCVTDNKKYMLIAWVHRDNKTVTLEKREIENGTLVKTADLQLGHANCLSYNPNTKEVYVALYSFGRSGSAGDSDDEEEDDPATDEIIVVDYENFTIKRRIQCASLIGTSGSHISGYCYDAINNKIVMSTKNSSGREMLVIDPASNTVIKRFPIFPPGTWTLRSGTYQGIQLAHNGYAYWVDSSYKAINVMDYMTGKAVGIIDIADFDDHGRPILEIQSISAKDKTDPNSDILVFHGGVAAKGSCYTNCACGWINPFHGYRYRRKESYVTDPIMGYLNPVLTEATSGNYRQNGNSDAPYVDPNLMFRMLRNKPNRITWNMINLSAGDYGIVYADNIVMRFNTPSGVANFKKLDIRNSEIHIKGIKAASVIASTARITFNSCEVTSGDIMSSSLTLVSGKGTYKGNSSSFVDKHGTTTELSTSGFIS